MSWITTAQSQAEELKHKEQEKQNLVLQERNRLIQLFNQAVTPLFQEIETLFVLQRKNGLTISKPKVNSEVLNRCSGRFLWKDITDPRSVMCSDTISYAIEWMVTEPQSKNILFVYLGAKHNTTSDNMEPTIGIYHNEVGNDVNEPLYSRYCSSVTAMEEEIKKWLVLVYKKYNINPKPKNSIFDLFNFFK